MKAVSGKAFTRVLERHGWKLLRMKGSHDVYAKEGSVVRLSVPVHGNKPMRKGFLSFFLKMAGFSQKDLG